jgi:hypothetical protein
LVLASPNYLSSMDIADREKYDRGEDRNNLGCPLLPIKMRMMNNIQDMSCSMDFADIREEGA